MSKLKKIVILMISIAFIFIPYECEGQEKKYKDNDLKNNEINVNITDVTIIEDEINIDKKYNASAIIDVKVANNTPFNIELSNINIEPYQGGKPTKYFVKTSTEEIYGFVGNLESGSTAELKIAIALHNTDDNIQLQMHNIEESLNNKLVHNINIK